MTATMTTNRTTAADPDPEWIEMAARRHGLSILDADREECPASSLAELEQFILAAGKARAAAGIGPNASLHLDGIWPELDPETLRVYLEVYLEALEDIFARQLVLQRRFIW